MAHSLEQLTVRRGDLIPCKTAFIDANTPGSDLKENFTIIGGGVSESADQHVHIRQTPGFNIGAAGQPPNCTNSLHCHHTAEVFFVQSGRWRFFWGNHGDAGEVILEEGDIFNIPTGIFRGFENIGTDYGMIMAILGGDDAGGGVVWAPQVIEGAASHGLVLGENGRLYDTAKGEHLPSDVQPMPKLSAEELKAFPEPAVSDVVRHFVARYLDLVAMAAKAPAKVIGAEGYLYDRPGFEVDFLTRHSMSTHAYVCDQPEVFMPMRGHWRIDVDGQTTTINGGDTCLVPAGVARSVSVSMMGEASLYRVRKTNDTPGPTQYAN